MAARGEPPRKHYNTKELLMKRVMTSCVVIALVLIFGIGSVLAADRKRDRKRDGTCRSYQTTDQCTDLTLAATKKRDQKRDGTCRSITNAVDDDSLVLAADQKRDRKRDGTCRS
jgi:Flp pilus assembly protein CpaB